MGPKVEEPEWKGNISSPAPGLGSGRWRHRQEAGACRGQPRGAIIRCRWFKTWIISCLKRPGPEGFEEPEERDQEQEELGPSAP